MNKKNAQQARGFTLVEVLVSVALFSIVMVVALGSLVALSSAVRRAEALDTATNNLSSALDAISRAARTGSIYHCGSGGSLSAPADCPDATVGAPSFSFLDADGVQVTYCLSAPGALTCNTSTACGAGSCSILRAKAGGSFVPLTAPEVNVTTLRFVVSGAPQGDNLQPRAVMLLVGTIFINNGLTSDFRLQTSVTQHLYDQ